MQILNNSQSDNNPSTRRQCQVRQCTMCHSSSCTTLYTSSSSSCTHRRKHHNSRVTIILMIVIQIVVTMSLLSAPCQATSRNMHQSKQSNHYYLTDYCDLRSKTLRNAKKIRTGPEKVSIKLESKDSMSSVRVLPQKASSTQRQASSTPLSSIMSFGLGSSAATPAAGAPPGTSLNIVQSPSTHNKTSVGETNNNNSSAQFNSTAVGNSDSTVPTNISEVTTTNVPMPSPEDIQQYQAPIFKRLNCSIIVVPPPAHGLLVTVNSIGLPRNHAKLGITLNYGSPQAQSISWDGDLKAGKYLLTQSASSMIAIHLQSFAPIDWSRVSFDILFTVYNTKANSTGCPNKSWFDCGDNICVPSSLVCDNNRNCPNGNDEMVFYRCYTPLFWSIAVTTTIALVIAIVILIVIMVLRRRRAAELAALSQSQFSNNLLQDSTGRFCGGDNYEAGYLADNMAGGFENPVWLHQTNTLTKRDSSSQAQPHVQVQAQVHTRQSESKPQSQSQSQPQPRPQPAPIPIPAPITTSTTSTFEPQRHQHTNDENHPLRLNPL